jgi:hypothetical protein
LLIFCSVRRLTILLDDVKVLLPKRELSPTQRQQLIEILLGCFTIFNKMHKKIEDNSELDASQPKDSSIGAKLRKAGKRVQWDPKDMEKLRIHLSANVGLLNTLYAQFN